MWAREPRGRQVNSGAGHGRILGVVCEREGGGMREDKAKCVKALHTLQCGCGFDGGKGEVLWVVSSCS